MCQRAGKVQLNSLLPFSGSFFYGLEDFIGVWKLKKGKSPTKLLFLQVA